MGLDLVVLSTLLKIVFVLAIILTFAPLIIWAERRQSAMMQDRIGPVRADLVELLEGLGVKKPAGFVQTARNAFGMGSKAHFGLAVLCILVGGAAALYPALASDGAYTLNFPIPVAEDADGVVTSVSAAAVFWIALALFAFNLGMSRFLEYLQRVFKGRVTVGGLLHPLADALKFIWKEDFVPPKADKFLHALAPILVVVTAIATFAVIPFADVLYLDHLGDVLRDVEGAGMCVWGVAEGSCLPTEMTGPRIPMQVAEINVGILFIFAVAGTGVVGAAIAGYSSDNKYSLLGGLRAAGQMVSYEVTLGLTIVPMFMIFGSLLLEDMVSWQANDPFGGFYPRWGIFLQPLAFILFFASSIAETKRIPFDVPEGESELVGGYLTEYSGMKFGMFFMGEFVEVVVLAAVATTLFFGGYDVPFLHEHGFELGFWPELGYIPLPHWAVVVIQMLAFTLKLALLIWFQLMIRWTLPRFRYDQIMNLCWKYILPLSLVNILATGLGILLFS
ncbi:MAG: complex I subunit 1 family protein [Myxococcota bacterium]